MKFVALIALGGFVFLASKGQALDDDFSQDSCTLTVPMAPDEPRDTPPLRSQSISLGSPFDYLISNGRPGGNSPHLMGHLSDLLRTTPHSSGSGKLKCTRGMTFCYRQPNENDSDLDPLGSQN